MHLLPLSPIPLSNTYIFLPLSPFPLVTNQFIWWEKVILAHMIKQRLYVKTAAGTDPVSAVPVHSTCWGCKTSPATPHMRVHSIKEDCCAACTRDKGLAAESHEKGLSCVSPVLAVLRPSHVCATTGFSRDTAFQPSGTQDIRKKGHLKTEQK